jgi:hypothetical protein
MPRPNKALTIIAVVAYMAIGASIAYAMLSGRLRGIFAIALSVPFVTVGYRSLLKYVGINAPTQPSALPRRDHALLWNLIKAVLCFGIGFAIAYFGPSRVPNDTIGVALIFGPGLSLLFIGVYFAVKGLYGDGQ